MSGLTASKVQYFEGMMIRTKSRVVHLQQKREAMMHVMDGLDPSPYSRVDASIEDMVEDFEGALGRDNVHPVRAEDVPDRAPMGRLHATGAEGTKTARELAQLREICVYRAPSRSIGTAESIAEPVSSVDMTFGFQGPDSTTSF
jgi:hypothetical protein